MNLSEYSWIILYQYINSLDTWTNKTPDLDVILVTSKPTKRRIIILHVDWFTAINEDQREHRSILTTCCAVVHSKVLRTDWNSYDNMETVTPHRILLSYIVGMARSQLKSTRYIGGAQRIHCITLLVTVLHGFLPASVFAHLHRPNTYRDNVTYNSSKTQFEARRCPTSICFSILWPGVIMPNNTYFHPLAVGKSQPNT